MHVTLISALYGDYEAAKPLPALNPAPHRAVMFTDNPDLHAPGWELAVEALDDLPNAMLRAKHIKIMAHTHIRTDVSIWVDASMTIIRDDFITLCLDALRGDDIAFMAHPWRDCIYNEAAHSSALEKYALTPIAAQAAYYRSIGHPEHWGLFASGHLVRHHNTRTRDHATHWWHENLTRSWQDQTSLPVITRLCEATWNTNLPWAKWWGITPHD